MFRATVIGLVVLAGAACATPRRSSSPPPASAAGTKTGGAKPTAPPARFATSADGTRLRYDVQGSGPAVMLLHGGGQTGRSWNERGYVERLARRFTVITFDQRGVGESGKPTTPAAYTVERHLADLTAVADAAGATRFSIWGYGQGATIARYALAQSDRVTRGVLVATEMGPAVSGDIRTAILGLRAKWEPLVAARDAGTLDLNALAPGDRAALAGDTPIAALALGALADFPPLEPAAITVPTLWIVGGGDSPTVKNAESYKDKLTGTMVELSILSGASYSDCFNNVDAVLKLAESFLLRETT